MCTYVGRAGIGAQDDASIVLDGHDGGLYNSVISKSVDDLTPSVMVDSVGASARTSFWRAGMLIIFKMYSFCFKIINLSLLIILI